MSSGDTERTRLNKRDSDRTVAISPDSAALPVGRPTIPEVELEEEIGRGGMGVVYKGRQPYLDRRVAVKLLLVERGGGDSEYVKRFQREAKILAGLAHPHIVGCYSAGVTGDGNPYLVMEFIDGPNLKEWVAKNGPLVANQALAVVRDLAHALEHANSQGIIHRDVKPENVLLAKREQAGADDPFPFQVKLVDLGLARPQRGMDMSLTQQGAVMGTPATMAPEQFDDPDNVDFRADIYGLGCVLFHALSGHAAYGGKSLAQIVSAKVSGVVPSLAQELKNLDRGVNDLAADLLARDKAMRPQSYANIVARCEGLISGKRLSGGSRPSTGLIAGAVIASLLVAGVGVGAAMALRGGDQPPRPPVAPVSPPAVAVALPPASTVPATPVAVTFGPALSLANADFNTGHDGWERIGKGGWGPADDRENTLVSPGGRIERDLDKPVFRLEGVLLLVTKGEETSKLGGIGVLLADGTTYLLAVKNFGNAIGGKLSVGIDVFDGAELRGTEQSRSIVDSALTIQIEVVGKTLTASIAGSEFKPQPLSALPKRVVLVADGPGLIQVRDLKISYAKP